MIFDKPQSAGEHLQALRSIRMAIKIRKHLDFLTLMGTILPRIWTGALPTYFKGLTAYAS